MKKLCWECRALENYLNGNFWCSLGYQITNVHLPKNHKRWRGTSTYNVEPEPASE